MSSSADRGDLYWHRNLGPELGFSKPEVISDDVGRVSVLEAIDVEGDGDTDVILALTDRLVWLENGDSWRERVIGDVAFAIQSFAR